MPKVSIVMAVYNGKKYLREAIDSILGQSFQDFEFIIVDDASVDGSVDVIKGYQDPRIKLIINEENMRLPRSLNRGMSYASGEYIARMDADDISMPDRIEKQVLFMDAHPDVAASSGNYIVIDETGKQHYLEKVRRGKQLERYVLFPSPLVHPAAIFRRSLLNEGYWYDEKYSSSQDYDLWLRIHEKYSIDNINETLLQYRIHGSSTSLTKREQQLQNACEIFNKFSPRMISLDDFKAITHVSFSNSPISQMFLMLSVFNKIDTFFFKRLASYTYHWLKQG